MSVKIMPPIPGDDDSDLEDEYEIQRLSALPDHLRELAALHAIDQFESVPSYIGRFAEVREEF